MKNESQRSDTLQTPYISCLVFIESFRPSCLCSESLSFLILCGMGGAGGDGGMVTNRRIRKQINVRIFMCPCCFCAAMLQHDQTSPSFLRFVNVQTFHFSLFLVILFLLCLNKKRNRSNMKPKPCRAAGVCCGGESFTFKTT